MTGPLITLNVNQAAEAFRVLGEAIRSVARGFELPRDREARERYQRSHPAPLCIDGAGYRRRTRRRRP